MKIAFIIIVVLVIAILLSNLLNIGAIFAYLAQLDFLPSFITSIVSLIAKGFTFINEYPVIILALLFFAIPVFLRILLETFLGGKQE